MNKAILIWLLLLMGTASASAQVTYLREGLILRPEFYGYGGISFPVGPDEFTDYWRIGFNLGGGIGYPVVPNLTLVGYLDYNRFRFDDDKFLRDYGFRGYGISISGGEASIIALSANLKAILQPSPSQVRPYFCGGIGFFFLSIGDVRVYDPYMRSASMEGSSETTFSVLLSVGIDFAIAERMDLFVEGRYAIGFTEGESTAIFPIKLGIKFK